MLAVTSCPSKVCGMLLVGCSSTSDGDTVVEGVVAEASVHVEGRVSIYYIRNTVYVRCANRTALGNGVQ